MKRAIHSIFIIILLIFFYFDLLSGQSQVKKVFPGWTSYTNSNYIKDLVLDKNILWAAAGGLIKYNLAKGTRVKYLKEHGIASNNVLKIVLHENTLWMATANGITCYHLRKNTWKSFYKADGLPDDAVTAVTVDKTYNRIWFGTWEGYLFNYNSVKKKWELLNAEVKIPDTIITSLALNPVCGSLLIGTWDSGLYSYIPGRHGSPVPLEYKKEPEKPLQCISGILQDNHQLWVGTLNRGLWLAELKKEPLVFKKIEKLSDYRITRIKVSPPGNKVLVTTIGNGLLIYSKKTGKWKTLDKKQGIPTDLLNTSVYDGGNIFLGSDGEGIIKLSLKTGGMNQYKSLNEIANNKVSVVTPDPQNNNLWIGTEGNGAAGFDIAAEKWTILNTSNQVLLSDVVNCIAVDGLHGTVWIGTDNGMVRYESRTGNYQRYGLEEGLDSIMVYAAGFDHINRLWAGFYIGSPAIFNPTAKRWKTIEEAPGVICYALSMDKKSKSVWMATPQGIINYHIKTGKSTNYWTGMEFRSLLFDAKKKEIWAGSWGEGLFRMKVETYQQQKIKRLENLSVLDIKKDEIKNTTWFATNAGAFYFDGESQKFGHLDVTSGLGLNFVLSIGITRDSIWFGTWGGGLSRLRKFTGGD